MAEMKAGSADGYMVRKAEEILVESRAMVADCQRRLATAAAELQQLIQVRQDRSLTPTGTFAERYR